MTNKIWEHWELCEKYYEVFGEYVPFELAFETVDYRIEWIKERLKEKGVE